ASPFFLGSSLAAATPGGLQISRSLRFNSSDSGYLSRVPGTAGNRKTWTWAGWVKRSTLSSNQVIFSSGISAGDVVILQFSDSAGNAGDTINLFTYPDSVTTARVFRDTSAWYHIVWTLDTTQSTASNRSRLYVNGVQVTDLSGTYPTQNQDYGVNATVAHAVGRYTYNSNRYFSGYLANIHFIDGQALTPSSFTETDATTGQLIPKTYTGSYGTNGFNLLFADNSSNTASTLGKDYSGLGNNWTPNNFSVTAGAGNDSLVDSPTNYGTDTGVGGTVRGNYCTWNPLDNAATLSDGNLKVTSPGASWTAVRGTFGISSGKWYWESTITQLGFVMIGVANSTNSLTNNFNDNTNNWGYFSVNGNKYGPGIGSGGTAYAATYAVADIISVALDMDAGTLTFYKNGSSLGQAFSGLSGIIFPFTSVYTDGGSGVTNINFGQRAFAYTAPSGFKALCTQNLPAPLVTKSNTVMDVVTYTGNGGTQSITGLAFSPNLLWFKNRSDANSHVLFDTVRGRSYGLSSNETVGDVTSDAGNDLASFDSSGFTVGPVQNWNSPNRNGQSLVAWAWDAGEGSAVSNTAGSITSQVRANATAGFSVVTWTAGSAPVTIGHGLGVAPQFIIIKSRTSGAVGWQVGHASLGWTKRLFFDTSSSDTTTAAWNDTSPTSTVFTVGSTGYQTGNMVAYCFSPVVGYSSFGSYTGNGSTDGPFIYTGFRPKFFMHKDYTAGGAGRNWLIWDAARETYNAEQTILFANLSNAESANAEQVSSGR
ncbi:MAG: hypothetical protein EBR82_56945, partial [Caulobacteraceae bacterium]|nr:hypothetical protein [Caulobacteraceae bacterium]